MNEKVEKPVLTENAEYLEMGKAKEDIIYQIDQIKVEENNILNIIKILQYQILCVLFFLFQRLYI